MENKVFIIAEIGWNHMGNMRLAEKMISSAKKAGADFCKFQTWKVKKLVKVHILQFIKVIIKRLN